jgi:hypothetical protein
LFTLEACLAEVENDMSVDAGLQAAGRSSRDMYRDADLEELKAIALEDIHYKGSRYLYFNNIVLWIVC